MGPLQPLERTKTPSLCAPVTAHQVRGDAEEPRPSIGPRTVERGAAIEGANERFRGDLLGQRSAKPPLGVAVHGIEVAVEDRGERLWLLKRALDHGRITRQHAHATTCPLRLHKFPAVV